MQRWVSWGSGREDGYDHLYYNDNENGTAVGVAQVPLPGKHEVLSSNPLPLKDTKAAVIASTY
jgi:hypothetical protein